MEATAEIGPRKKNCKGKYNVCEWKAIPENVDLIARACADHEEKIVLLLSQCGEAQNVYFRACFK